MMEGMAFVHLILWIDKKYVNKKEGLLWTAGTTVENKGKLILTEIFPSVQKHDI